MGIYDTAGPLNWLEQAGYQPGGTFGGWGDPSQWTMPPIGQLALPSQTAAPLPVGQPMQPPAGNAVSPPAELPSQYLPIGDYRMPQFGAPQATQSAGTSLDLGDRLSAGFKSWAYTPVGNPFAALANAITGFTSGQFAAAPAPGLSNVQLRSLSQPSTEEGTTVPSASPGSPAPSPFNTRMLMRRNVMGRR